MRESLLKATKLVVFLAGVLLSGALSGAFGQSATGVLRGQVTDPSGATLVGATVLVTTPAGGSMDTTTNKDGVYEFKDLPAGIYEVKAVAQGFALFTKSGVAIAAGQPTRLNISLTLEVQQEQVTVNATTTQLDVNPNNNANTIVLQGKDLEALSDDPDDLSAELQALAGPSAGPNGGQIYIDGFTGGQLPPKASIREIRINQNPFSSEYDKLGYGRIEVFTKPGTDKLHGQLMVSGTSSAFNARNPFEDLPEGESPPGYHSVQYSGSIGGAINKKTSFFFNLEQRDLENLNIVSATILDPNFNIVPFSDAVSNPQTRTNLSPRFDFQLSPNNTLTARYQYFRDSETNDGVGQFNLAETGNNSLETEHTLQVTDTQIIGAHVIEEVRFQYVRDDTVTKPVNPGTSVNVGGAFTGFGSGGLNNTEVESRYEFQNITYWNYGKHAWKFGGRLRYSGDENTNTSNFLGQFSFDSIQQYQTFLQSGIGTPTYYSQTVGTPTVSASVLDLGIFAQDDWKVRQNVTISYGLRVETQDNLGNKANFAPRLGFAWGIGGNAKNPPKFVLRGGFGMFYDRFTYSLLLEQERLNGTLQQQYLIPNPTFYLSATPLTQQQLEMLPAGTSVPTIYASNPNLHAPYVIQSGLTLERQLTKSANIAVTYLNSRGDHQFYTNNINAMDPNNGNLRPLESQYGDQNVFQYQSEGVFKQNQLIVNGSVRMGAKLSLFGYYTLNYSKGDTSGPTSFSSNPFDLQQDYGRSSFDIRNRVFFGGTVGLPRGFRLSPFLIASSGIPFNITTGTDLYGDNLFNSRPAFAASCPPGTQTNFGCFNAEPSGNYTPIPINYGEGPGRFSLNLRVSKTFGFGPTTESAAGAGGGGGMSGGTFGRGPGGPGGGRGGPGGGRGMDAGTTNHRYGLTIGASARNIFNNVNVATPIGNLNSPLFGESNGLAPRPFGDSTSNRRIDLQLTFTF
jgi:Carboxypeptidase regulatory-like domain